MYKFHEYSIDLDKQLVYRDDGEVVRLTPRVFDLLAVLVTSDGRMLTKDELLKTVWADSVVEESNLSQSIFILRRSLGETANNPRFIKTIPGRGYRFIAPVTRESDDDLVIERSHSDQSENSNNNEQDVSERARPFSHADKFRTLSLGVALIFLILVGAAAFTFYRGSAPKPGELFRSGVSRLTSSGNEVLATISPDGKYIAHIATLTDGRHAMQIRQTNVANDRDILPPANRNYFAPVFSPDSRYIYYFITTSGKTSLYRIPALGGEPLLVQEGFPWSPFAIAPDGDRIAYLSADNPQQLAEIKLSSISAMVDRTDQPRVITPRPGYLDYLGKNEAGPRWSPDGKLLAVPFHDRPTGRDMVAIFDPDGGGDPRILDPKFTSIGSAAWFDTSEFLISAAKGDTGRNLQIWRVDLNGAAEQLTTDLNDYGRLSLATDGSALVTTQSRTESDLYVAGPPSPGGKVFDEKGFRQITHEVSVVFGNTGMTWAPDGRLVYQYAGVDGPQLRSVNADGSDVQIMTDQNVRDPQFPSVTRNGEYLFFISPDTHGQLSIYRLRYGTRSAQPITSAGPILWFAGFSLSPDDRSMIFTTTSESGESGGLRRISMDGSDPVDLLTGAKDHPKAELSPDGKLLALMTWDFKLQIRPIADQANAARSLDIWKGRPCSAERYFKWTPDGKGVIYMIEDRPAICNLHVAPIDGSPPYSLTNFTDARSIYSFALTPDGQTLAVARGITFKDIVLAGSAH